MGAPRIGRIFATVLVNLPASIAHAAARVEGVGVDPNALLRLTLALGVVLAVIVALAWLLRRMARFNRSVNGQLRILGGLAVGNRERIVLVQVGRAQLLVGVAPGRVQTLHVLDEPVETPQTASAAGDGRSVSFAKRLRAMLDEHGKR